MKYTGKEKMRRIFKINAIKESEEKDNKKYKYKKYKNKIKF